MRKIEYVGKVKELRTPVIAKVNNVPITVEDYIFEKSKLPENLKDLLKNPSKRLQFVQNLIDKQLLYQESKKLKIDRDEDFIEKLNQLKKDLMIEELLRRKIYQHIVVSEREMKNYYNSHKEEFEGDFEEVKSKIKKILESEKRKKLFEAYIKSLRKSAQIEINKEEIKNLN